MPKHHTVRRVFTFSCACANSHSSRASVRMLASAPVDFTVQAQDCMTGIRTIGVIGAGQMGNGIAHVCALAGFDVLLNDVSAERLEAGIKTIQRNMDRQVHRQMITSDARDAALKRIRTATSLTELGEVDFAIEAATEKEDVKRKIFDELCPQAFPRRRCWRPTPRPSRSHASAPRPTGPSASSASIS